MLAPWKKSYDQLRQHIKKQRHYFANKAPSSQSYGFSSSHVWMWELEYKESWGPKNWRFWIVELEKTLESPLDCKEINQSILKEISSGCSLEGLMLMLKLQYFGHLMKRTDSLEKTLMLGKIEGRRRRRQQRMRWLDGITDSMDMSLSMSNSGSWQWTGRPGVLQSMVSQSWIQLSDWTELSWAPKENNQERHSYHLSLLQSPYSSSPSSCPSHHHLPCWKLEGHFLGPIIMMHVISLQYQSPTSVDGHQCFTMPL